MRVHTVIAFYVLIFSCFFELSIEKYILLFLTIGSVLSLEMINTSIEGIIDICSKEYNALAKVAKDIAAGAVMVASFVAVIIGLILFCDFSAYINMWAFFCSHKIVFAVLILSFLLSVVYVRFGPVEMKNQIKSKLKKFKL